MDFEVKKFGRSMKNKTWEILRLAKIEGQKEQNYTKKLTKIVTIS